MNARVACTWLYERLVSAVAHQILVEESPSEVKESYHKAADQHSRAVDEVDALLEADLTPPVPVGPSRERAEQFAAAGFEVIGVGA